MHILLSALAFEICPFFLFQLPDFQIHYLFQLILELLYVCLDVFVPKFYFVSYAPLSHKSFIPQPNLL